MSELEALRKPDWIPYYIQRIKGSSAWQLPDFQFCWYWKLLTEAADSDIPGYLVNDVRTLWRLAGARTEKFFRERGGMELVARYFSRTDDGLHIYNGKLLEVLHEQMSKLTKRRRRNISSLSISVQEVPDFIPGDTFHEYLEMREKIKKPATPNAIKLAYSKLATLKEQGFEPKAVLEQSIFNSWQGLFPVKQVANGNGKAINQAGHCPIHPDSGKGPNGQCWGCYNESPEQTLARIREKANAAH